jgi:hypothetical protein
MVLTEAPNEVAESEFTPPDDTPIRESAMQVAATQPGRGETKWVHLVGIALVIVSAAVLVWALRTPAVPYGGMNEKSGRELQKTHLAEFALDVRSALVRNQGKTVQAVAESLLADTSEGVLAEMRESGRFYAHKDRALWSQFRASPQNGGTIVMVYAAASGKPGRSVDVLLIKLRGSVEERLVSSDELNEILGGERRNFEELRASPIPPVTPGTVSHPDDEQRKSGENAMSLIGPLP